MWIGLFGPFQNLGILCTCNYDNSVLGFFVQVFTEEKQNLGFSRQDLRRMEYLVGTLQGSGWAHDIPAPFSYNYTGVF